MIDQPVLFYDITTDQQRSITQADVDGFHGFVMWHLEMREIVSVLTQQGANRRFTRQQLQAIKELMGI